MCHKAIPTGSAVVHGSAMASRKPARKAQKKSPRPRKPAPAKKPTAKKPAAKRPTAKPAAKKPPMHATVTHPELDEGGEHDETFEIFKTFDRDGSGSIDSAELSRLLEALGQRPDDDELAIALDVVDANRSGRISWDEFKAWWSGR